MSSKGDIFDQVSQNSDIFDQIAPSMKEEPLSATGAAQSYGAGFVGGAGGLIPDLMKLFEPLAPVSQIAGDVSKISKLAGLKTTPELTQSLAQQQPQNALERILQQSGQFGGQEALLGTGFGGMAGPAGAASGAGLGALHGSASGAFYGGLKELGLDDEWALGLTMLATLSPIAAQKLFPKLATKAKSGVSFSKAYEDMLKERADIMEGPPPPPPPSPPTEKELVSGVVGENLPISSYTTAEKALEATQPKPKIEEPSLGIKLKISPSAATPEKTREVKIHEGPGQAISPEFETDAAGGQAVNLESREKASQERKKVSEIYKQAEENYKDINSIGDEYLINDLQTEANKIRESAKPNTAEATVLKTIDDILFEYQKGNYLPVRRLIRTSDSLTGMSNYELPFTGPKDILKRVAKSLDDAAIRAIKNNGGNPKLQELANKKYGEWASKYSNDDIVKFMERTVNNPESLFKMATEDPGAFRAIENAIGDTAKGKKIVDGLARRIAENRMNKWTNHPQFGSVQYHRDLRNLESVIGKERTQRYALEQKKLAKIPRPTELPKPTAENKLNKLIERIAEHSKLKPETIQSKLNSRSGIKELKKELKNEPRLLEILLRQKAKSVLHQGQIHRNFTGDDLFQILNRENNYDLLAEIIGDKHVESLYEASRAIGKENMSNERIKKFFAKVFKEGAKATVGAEAFRIIESLL